MVEDREVEALFPGPVLDTDVRDRVALSLVSAPVLADAAIFADVSPA